ncbi:hypothetical protein C823_000694 [Eubacterium plexicaudatum ASF492]|uniref:Uncharacterized protein n=1 Tax=Eubacterium plexicaudatum ASF492 TaxID=1235802 RepID=N2A2Q7_9FIRM|nr:hypothetical protein C823_000694 [Eubacterium plexicaudatum ASF492]
MNKKFYERTWFVVMCCIIFPPAGIFLIWKNKKPDRKSARIFISAILCLWTLAIAMVGSDEENLSSESREQQEETTKTKAENEKSDRREVKEKGKGKQEQNSSDD